MYKAFNTFIDDLFAFIITMPTAHRVACFRLVRCLINVGSIIFRVQCRTVDDTLIHFCIIVLKRLLLV